MGSRSRAFLCGLVPTIINSPSMQDRFELPHIRAVHFLLHDHLDRGVNCTSSVDFLGKNVAEFLRAREVDVPRRFLKRTRDGAKL